MCVCVVAGFCTLAQFSPVSKESYGDLAGEIFTFFMPGSSSFISSSIHSGGFV